MQQIWIPRIGEPEVLELREAQDPEPKTGEVRVRVNASGINFADILARMGLYPDAPKLPAVVGYEVAGVVDGFRERVLSVVRGNLSDPVRAGRGDIITFTPRGTATPASIYLTDHRARMRVLRIYGGTGRVISKVWRSGWPEWRTEGM